MYNTTIPNKSILITGGAGFIGSHLVRLFVKKYPEIKIINLDALTYAGDLRRLKDIDTHKNYFFIKGDICDAQLISKIFTEYQIDGVVHLAAESHVDNSLKNPKIFLETNILGTENLLDAAKNLWLTENRKLKKQYQQARFLHVSTDEVYGSLGKEGLFTEDSPYAPNSPYSASKASSEMIVRSYFHSFNLPTIISNCSNNYGPMQHSEKLIPKVVESALSGKEIPIYGNGSNIRDWLYVEDHCDALELIFYKGKIGEKYNIGTNNELSNLDLVQKICQILDRLNPKRNTNYAKQIRFIEDRAGHDFRYAIDSNKISRELGWLPKNKFESALTNTILGSVDIRII